MSIYERQYFSTLISFQLMKAREAYMLTQTSNIYLFPIRGLAEDAMKMNFILIFEIISLAKKLIGLDKEFPFSRMSSLKNQISRGFYGFDNPQYLKGIVELLPAIEFLATHMAEGV